MIRLKEIRIINFKSFKDTKWIKLNKFNVLIGPNGSGKTNFIEFFKFLKKALVEESIPYVPYSDWWSYKNIVWKGQENLPIYCGLKFDVDGYEVLYDVTFSGAGGTFRILKENFEIKGLIKLKRNGSSLRIIHNYEFITQNLDDIKKLLYGSTLNVKDILEQEVTLPFDFKTLLAHPYQASYQYEKNLSAIFIEFKPKTPTEKPSIIISPTTESDTEGFVFTNVIFDTIRENIHSYIRRFTIMHYLNIKDIKSSFYPTKESLKEDCSNLMSVVYTLFEENGYKLPERIEYGIKSLFPNFSIGFERGSLWGDIVLKIYENDHVLYPPCIPDGFYKILAILTAIETKPSIIAIDEIENSLHAEALEYIIDELKHSEAIVIIATHSPIVVDIVDLEDLTIVEKYEESKLKRIEEPRKVRRELEELGITPSESWLYGGRL